MVEFGQLDSIEFFAYKIQVPILHVMIRNVTEINRLFFNVTELIDCDLTWHTFSPTHCVCEKKLDLLNFLLYLKLEIVSMRHGYTGEIYSPYFRYNKIITFLFFFIGFAIQS